MKQYVQHKSGQGRVFQIIKSSGFCWYVHLSDLEQDCWLPKSEYIPCDPPKEWEDVTASYNHFNGKSWLRVHWEEERIRFFDGMHNGPCFIVERKKS